MRFKCPVFMLMIWLAYIVIVGNVLALDSAEELSDGIPPGHMRIEGDIIVPEDFFTIKAAYQANLWTSNQVPYEFNANVIAANQALMQVAMQEWENASAVNFVHCLNNNCTGNYLHIQNATENSSFVGMNGGEQVVNIFNWNMRFIMAHELGHALGYWHEHERDDRNQYLQIHPGNVDPSDCDSHCFSNNFSSDAPNNYGPFDFDSVMHYGECTFALPGCPCAVPSNCQTIEILMACNTMDGWCTNTASVGRACSTDADCDPRTVGVCSTNTNTCVKGRIGAACTNNVDCDIAVGQRDHLSQFDGLTMSFLYAEVNWRFVDQSHTGPESGTFLEPFRTVDAGFADVPNGGTVIIQPGSYNQTGSYAKEITLRAPLRNVTIRAPLGNVTIGALLE